MGILDQVWCLIVSIPDLCTLTYSDQTSSSDMGLQCFPKSLGLYGLMGEKNLHISLAVSGTQNTNSPYVSLIYMHIN